MKNNILFDINSGMDYDRIYLRYKLIQAPGSIHVGYSLDDLPEFERIEGKLMTIPVGYYINVGSDTQDGVKVYHFVSEDNQYIFAIAEQDLVRLVGTWGVDIISMRDKNGEITIMDNPYKEIFNEIDNSENKVAAYKSIVNKLADDMDLTIEEKANIIALS